MLDDSLRNGLQAVVAARAELDERERKLVVEARSMGATWTDLGAVLGLSKQGARRRHLAVDPIHARRSPGPATLEEMLAALGPRLRR